MALEDRYVTATPEGVSLDTVLAGLGSRFFAYLIDLSIQAGILLVGYLAIAAAGGLSGTSSAGYVYTGVFAALYFVDYFGYFILCELVTSGRSPGKRAAGIRVVRLAGGPITFKASLLRNVLRLIDGFPQPFCLIGSVIILSTAKNQRLGDLLAGTVVVRERRGTDRALVGGKWESAAQWADPGHWQAPVSAPYQMPGGVGAWGPYAAGPYAAGPYAAGPYAAGPYAAGPYAAGPYAAGPYAAGPGFGAWSPPPEAAHWDVSAVSPEHVAVVQTFLHRRYGFTPDARMRLSRDLMIRIAPLVHGPTGPMEPERFLELVVMVKAARG